MLVPDHPSSPTGHRPGHGLGQHRHGHGHRGARHPGHDKGGVRHGHGQGGARRGYGALVVSIVMTVLVGACSSGAPSTTTGPTVPEMASPVAAVEAITSSLQLDLMSLGYDPGAISGQFSAATEVALRKFQATAGVSPVERGALGPLTADAIGAHLGASSEAVRALQSALTDIGLFGGVINGRYNLETVAAVKVLQRQVHVPVDGLFGPKTATALTRRYAHDVPEPAVPPTTRATTTTTTLDTTPTTTPATTSGGTTSGPGTTIPATDLLRLGSRGPAVTALQARLTALGYRPGAADGVFGASTGSAVLAFQKREGLSRDGVVGPELQAALAAPTGAGPRTTSPTPRIEVDIARQIAFVLLPSQPVITLNVSSGNGKSYQVPGGGTDVAFTPVGSFTAIRKIAGDHVAPLGTLHNPIYFFKGWAIHGAASVPAYPASHGCVRISNSDADWLFPLIPVGTAIVLYDSTGHSPGPNEMPSTGAPGF